MVEFLPFFECEVPIKAVARVNYFVVHSFSSIEIYQSLSSLLNIVILIMLNIMQIIRHISAIFSFIFGSIYS